MSEQEMNGSAVTKARQVIEHMGGVYIGQQPCGCHLYRLGDGGAAVAESGCEIDHSEEFDDAAD